MFTLHLEAFNFTLLLYLPYTDQTLWEHMRVIMRSLMTIVLAVDDIELVTSVQNNQRT